MVKRSRGGSNSPIKWNAQIKEALLTRIQDFLKTTHKLSTIINRIHLKGGWVYLYYLIKPFDPESMGLTKDDYVEEDYARITMKATDGTSCDVNWCRHTGQWVSMYEGSLEECLQFIESEEAYFSFPPSTGVKYHRPTEN